MELSNTLAYFSAKNFREASAIRITTYALGDNFLEQVVMSMAEYHRSTARIKRECAQFMRTSMSKRLIGDSVS